jgi:site-specific DNA-methyltransferase (adenine-specific)
MFTIHNADSLDLLKTLPDHSVHAVVTDPPYGLVDTSPAQVAECLLAWARGETWTPKGSGFMGKSWDAWVPPPELWREVLRVLRPGGHALVFAGSRTSDLMSLSLRLAGFEIRDTMQWLYGSGFPKSHNVSKALDKQAGEQGEVLHTETRYNEPNGHDAVGQGERTLVERVVRAPATEHAQQWQGWGTALKPAFEPVIMARKPLKGTVVQNTLEHGCGGINVDGCRVEWSEGEDSLSTTRPAYTPHHSAVADMNTSGVIYSDPTRQLGRWPANVILDPEAGALLDAQAGEPVSRYFYCAKASRAEREAGLQGHETKTGAQLTGRQEGSVGLSAYAGTRGSQPRANIHPTVKPINLMRYLVRLVTPSHGTVLDPFTGSGSTGCAAVLERVNFVGIERENEYARIATARIEYWATQAQADAPQADTPPADTPPADTAQADTHPADTHPADTHPAHKTTRGARRKAPAEDDPQGSLF